MDQLGVASAIASAVAYGIAPTIYGRDVAKCGVHRALPVFAMFALAASPLLPWGQASVAGLALTIAAAVIGGAVGGSMYLKAASISPALGNSSSSSYVVFAALIGREWGKVTWAILVFLGLALLSRGGGRVESVAYGVAAAVSWGFSINIMHEAVNLVGPGAAQAIRSATLIAIFAAVSRGRICVTRRILVGAFMDSFVGFTTFIYALSLLGPAATAIIVGAYPAVTAVVTRELGKAGWVGLMFVAAGVVGAAVL